MSCAHAPIPSLDLHQQTWDAHLPWTCRLEAKGKGPAAGPADRLGEPMIFGRSNCPTDKVKQKDPRRYTSVLVMDGAFRPN